MSQAGVINTSGGPVPPDVPTSFITDNGTVIPSANIVFVNGSSTNSNDINGIQVIANPDGSNSMLVELTNRATGGMNTNDDIPRQLIFLDLGSAQGTYAIQGYVAAYSSGSGAAYFFDSAIKTNGTTATEIGTNFTTVLEDTPLEPAEVDVTVSGNGAVVQITGIAATSIFWQGIITFTVVNGF